MKKTTLLLFLILLINQLNCNANNYLISSSQVAKPQAPKFSTTPKSPFSITTTSSPIGTKYTASQAIVKNNAQYPVFPIINNYKMVDPFGNLTGGSSEIYYRNLYDSAKEYYEKGQYSNAQKAINKVLPYYSNSLSMLMLKSQIEDGLGNNTIAMEYANKVLSKVQDEQFYLWRAYLMIKSGDASKLPLIYKDLDNTNIRINNIFKYGGEIIWALNEDKNISSTMKADIYKYHIKKANASHITATSVPITACYIQFIYSLSDSDPLFKKLGKTKTQILSAYLTALKDEKIAPFIRGIMKIASGNTRVGQKEIISAFAQTSKYDNSMETIVEMVGASLRLIKPMPRKIDSYSIGVKVKPDETLTYIIVDEILNPDLYSKGIQRGDKIVKINGKTIASIGDINDVGEYMRGKKDTTVKIEIPRIPGEIALNRTYHIQAQVYDYFILPKYIKTKDGTISIGPHSRKPSGMIMYNPNYNYKYNHNYWI